MNLGIEDAFILSNLIHEGKLGGFDEIRRPYLTKTVNAINNVTMGLAGNSRRSRIIRKNIGLLRLFAPLVLPRARKSVLGINEMIVQVTEIALIKV